MHSQAKAVIRPIQRPLHPKTPPSRLPHARNPLGFPPARRLGAMPFDLVEEHVMLRDLVAKFVDNELMPLEKAVMAREAAGGEIRLTDEEFSAAARQVPGARPLGARRAGGGRRHEPAGRGAGRRQRGTRAHDHPLRLPARLAQPPHAAGRRRRAPEEALHGALCQRRGAFRHRDLRAGRGRRPRGHDHPRGQGRRPLGHRRAQDLDQPRALMPISPSSWR